MMELTLVKKDFVNVVDKIILSSNVAHAYIIELDNYDSDYEYVLSFVKMILFNCKYQDIHKLKLNVCNLIDSNNYPDLVVIEPDGATIKKAQLLSLQKEFSNKSNFENKRIYIIKCAEKMNDASANTILKFLEEPEDDIVALLLTNNRYNIIETVLSRCQVLELKSFTCDSLTEEIVLLSKYLINPRLFFTDYSSFFNEIVVEKDKLKNILIDTEHYIMKFLKSEKNDIAPELISLFSSVNKDYLVKCILIIEKNISKLYYNVNFKLWLDSFFSQLVGG